MNAIEMTKKCFEIKLKISDRFLVSAAYLYMIVPTLIFFLGWLRLPLGILFSIILSFGFIWHIKKNYSLKNTSVFEISLGNLAAITVLVLFWVYMSGIGGYTFQRWDFHFRNAVLRDLTEFSWPVIYPETNNGLVYYFAHWLVPALVGKILGYVAANFVLYIWSALGIFISLILLAKLLRINNFRKLFTLCILFMGFGFPRQFIDLTKNIFAGTRFENFLPYRFTNHSEAIVWVFNQTIVPFVATALFLNEKSISSLALIGLLVLPFAPFPFIGIFMIFVLWGIVKLIQSLKEGTIKLFLRSVFSIPNLCAIFSIFIVFLFFFSCNSATNGVEGIGGIHLNIPELAFTQKKRFLFWLFVIDFCNFGIFALLLFKENKKNPLFYISLISIIMLQFIQIGTSQDFCWRSTVPAMFMLFSMITKNILTTNINFSFRKFILACTIGISFVNCFFVDFMYTTKQIVRSHFTPVLADSIYTFSDKNLHSNWHYYNFLCPQDNEHFFYKFLAKRKDEKLKNKDLLKIQELQDNRGLFLSEGFYSISPKQNKNLYLSLKTNSQILNYDGKDLIFSEEKTDVYITHVICTWEERDRPFNDTDKIRISFPSENSSEPLWNAIRLDIPWGKINDKGEVSATYPNNSGAQKFKLVKKGDFFSIFYGDYALTFDSENNSLKMKKYEPNDETQLWYIAPSN